MKVTHFITVSALALTCVAPMASAENAASTLSDAQKTQIEKVVHDYLVNKPEVLIEASRALQQKQQDTMQKQAKGLIQENGEQLFKDSLATAGNPKGKVTVVEFFDYNCFHCKTMSPIMDSLLKKDPNIRVVYKDFPIFGKPSETAARAALAASLQNKNFYKQMHDALFNQKKDADIMETAKSIHGLNIEKLKKDMDSPKVDGLLSENRQLGEKLHLMGTPAFIIAETPDGQFKSGSYVSFFPGALSEKKLEHVIKKASNK